MMTNKMRLLIVLAVVGLFALWFTRQPLVMICSDRPPVLIYGEWWDGTCTYTTGPGMSSGAVEIQTAACYCEWWLERHPELTWRDCKYPQVVARYFHGTDGLCKLIG